VSGYSGGRWRRWSGWPGRLFGPWPEETTETDLGASTLLLMKSIITALMARFIIEILVAQILKKVPSMRLVLVR
jgi:hypothetical protein